MQTKKIIKIFIIIILIKKKIQNPKTNKKIILIKQILKKPNLKSIIKINLIYQNLILTIQIKIKMK